MGIGKENLFQIAEKEVENWFLMGSYWPVTSIVISYLIFVSKIGPQYMKDRKPLNIKLIILVYNLLQIVFNAFLVSKMFTVTGAIEYLWKHGCHPLNPAVNPYYIHVFFILRKKQSHVTFLHVYHHANMAVITWAYLKYIKGEQGVIVGWINAVVHVVMYTYYFLAALGPVTQKYLWWKKYLTKLQIIQFILIITYMMTLLFVKCDLPKLFTYLVMFQGFVFLVLFTNFYIKAYVSKPKKINIVNGYTNGITQTVGNKKVN